LEQLIRIRLFLDLPVMLHAHHDFFEDGIDHFNSIAMMVNRIQPKVVWASLGGVALNLYLQRRLDNKVEVLSFSPQMVLKNTYEEPTLWSVTKREDGSVPIGSVQVDGIEHAFTYDGNFVRMNIPMDPGTEKKVVIQYKDMGGNRTFADEKIDVEAILIRKLSDFRYNYLFRLPFGSLIVAEISKKKASMVFFGIGVFVLISYLAIEGFNNKKILNLRVS
jgi:hypothetical protein